MSGIKHKYKIGCCLYCNFIFLLIINFSNRKDTVLRNMDRSYLHFENVINLPDCQSIQRDAR